MRLTYRQTAIAACLAGLVLSGPAMAAEIRCTVVLDADSGKPLHREGDCDRAVYPMSTFKLPLAMMGYDAGVLTAVDAPRWSYQARFKRSPREQKDTDPQIWLRDSIVWYSQELTRKLGKETFADYVKRFSYGNRDVSGGPGKTDGLTEAWLMSSLKISPDQQVAFLDRFLKGELPISEKARQLTIAATPSFPAADGWTVKGKTGAGSMRDKAGKSDPNRPIGWFVGWADKGTGNSARRVVFARLLVDDRPHKDAPISYTVRDGLIADLPKLAQSR